MTISPSGSWIWQNGHYRSIRNGPNSRKPVWLCWKWVRNELNRSKNRFCTSDGSLGLNREYGARVAQSSSTSIARGWDWATVTGISGGACGSPRTLIFAPVSSYGLALHCGMIKMCFWQLWKFGYIPKTLLFSDEQGSDTNCWWEKPLVVALKHSEGIKHTVLFQ